MTRKDIGLQIYKSISQGTETEWGGGKQSQKEGKEQKIKLECDTTQN